MAPQNQCELHRVILRIKEEISANEERTSSSSAASTPSHTGGNSSSNTKFAISSCEITDPSQNQSNNKEHIYSNGFNSYNGINATSNNKANSDKNSFRSENGMETSEICNMMLGCDISSSTSGVDTSTAGSSSFSDSNNGVDGKPRDCNESGISTDRFDEHSTSLVI